MVARQRSTILNMKRYVRRRNQYEAVVQRSSASLLSALELMVQPSCFRLDKHYSWSSNITERRSDSDVDLPRRLWSHKMELGICVRVRACVCVEQLWCLTSFGVCVRACTPNWAWLPCWDSGRGASLDATKMTGTASGMTAQRKNEKQLKTHRNAHTFVLCDILRRQRSGSVGTPPPSVAGSARCRRASCGASEESSGHCGLKDRGFAVAGCESYWSLLQGDKPTTRWL